MVPGGRNLPGTGTWNSILKTSDGSGRGQVTIPNFPLMIDPRLPGQRLPQLDRKSPQPMTIRCRNHGLMIHDEQPSLPAWRKADSIFGGVSDFHLPLHRTPR